jgi:hypothetical protein
MEAVEEGRTGEGFVEDLAIGLEKVSPAGGLAEGAVDPATEEPEIIERTVAVNTADIIGENADGRSHELVEKVGICHSIIGGADRLTGAKMHSRNVQQCELERRPDYRNGPQKEMEQESSRRRRDV